MPFGHELRLEYAVVSLSEILTCFLLVVANVDIAVFAVMTV